jgi:hypothetical protein
MRQLDQMTLERLARVICDIDGPYERAGWQLEGLMARAGWPDPPLYDGGSRVPWLQEQLAERRDRTGDLDRLICRVCDPIEYEDGADAAESFRAAVNLILRAERLVVSRSAGRPVLGELADDGASTTYSAPPDMERRLRELISDVETADVLYQRLRETEICAANGAFTFAVIGLGSFVEGILQAVLEEHDSEIAGAGFRDGKGAPMKQIQIGLHFLINTAHSRGWIQLDAADFMQTVREYRNYVHPHKQMVNKVAFDQDSVMLCWAPVRAIINDLEERVIASRGGEPVSV